MTGSDQRVTTSSSQKAPVKVLLVDDDPLIHLIFKRVVAKIPAQIVLESAMQPLNGLEKFRHFSPDVIFLDINMPQMSGWEFLEAMGEEGESCKVFMYSSSIDPFDQNKVKNYPRVSEYVIKPITAEKLAVLIH